MMDPYHQSFEEFPNRPRTPGAKAHKYVRALYHALSRAILGEVGSQKADPNLSAIHSWKYDCDYTHAQVISSFTKGIVPLPLWLNLQRCGTQTLNDIEGLKHL